MANGRKPALGPSLAAVIGTAAAAVLCVYAVWSVSTHRSEVEARALLEAQTLNAEMESVWDYINAQQDVINYDFDGTYHFRGVYCTVAAKGVAQRFMGKTDVIVRYVRDNPRSGTDWPDAFEAQAIAAWERDGTAETYEFTEFEGEPALRYTSALIIKGNCLKCHGGPAGEKDETGYFKEGMEAGDLAGLASIVVPMRGYASEVAGMVAADLALMAALVTVVGGAAWLFTRRWVSRPLGLINRAAREVGAGNFGARAGIEGARAEIQELAGEFEDMARELAGLYATLEGKVADRTSELAHANERLMEANALLEQSNEYKSGFLTIVSHELRTPLASIIAFADILARPGCGDEETRAMAVEIGTNAKTLLSMINNIIDAAKLEAGRFELCPEAVDLVDLFSEVEHLVGPAAVAKGVALSTRVEDDVPVVLLDRDALRKVVVNLVGNAVKFTDEGTVDIAARTAGDAAVEIVVSDTGVGIAEADRETIFERFVQPDMSLSRRRGGSGLGLSLVRDLVGKMGGSVKVESQVGAGSTFIVTLPATQAGAGALPPEEQEC